MCAMMTTGPISTAPVEAPNLNTLNLKLYQRITAQVLEVRGIEATLAIEGTPVVAKMPRAAGASNLLQQGTAQFVITQLSSEGITLRLLQQEQQAPSSAVIQPRDLATRLLEALGLAKSDETMMLAQAALKQGVLVTPETLSELETALQQLGAWGEEEADLAVALKAAGLPVTPGSIQMIAQKPDMLGDALAKLMMQLKGALARNPSSPELTQLLQESIRLMDKSMLKWQQPAEKLSRDLEFVSKLLGRSFENEFAQQIKDGNKAAKQESLSILGKLQQSLQKNGQGRLAGEVEKFIDTVRQNHLVNVKSDPSNGRGHWAQLDIPLSIKTGNANQENVPARIRIAKRERGEGEEIDPNYTRLILQVEVAPGEPMEIDLAMASGQVQADITVPNVTVEQLAVTEWPGLQESLHKLGFQVKTSRVDVGRLNSSSAVPQPSQRAQPYQSVDIEI